MINMRSSISPVRAVIGLAAGLLLASLDAAEAPHPLMGATRDHVLSRYGEPKGQISVGPRTVLTYAHEKLVLRNGVVVEVERLSAEPVRRPAPVESVPADSVASATAVAPVPTQPHVGTENAPTPPPAVTPATSGTGPASAPGQGSAAPAGQPKLAIKLVRPPGAGGPSAPRPAPVVEAPTPQPVNETPEPEPAPPPGPDPRIEAERAARAAQAAAQAAAEAAANEKRAKSAQSARRRLDFAETAQDEEAGMGKTLLIAALVVVAGFGGLAWWRRQQSIELEATSVARTPVKKAASAPAASNPKVTPFPAATPPAPPAAKPSFTSAFLAQLDATRFEELVAAYFVRTGVVATRVSSGGASPVHLRLSWKGEPRAFACAHCIPQGPDDIEARALHAFVEALAAENLRRGYVVTSGGFSSGAVKFAASKQIILLSADTLLEKIKGLPESARNELMQVLTADKKAA